MVVPSIANGFRAVACALRSLDGGGCKFPHIHANGGPQFAATGGEPGQGEYLTASSGRSWRPSTFMSRQTCSCVPAVASRTQPRTVHSHPTSLFPWRGGLKCPRCDLSSNSAVCECRWSRTWRQTVPCNINAASASDTRSVNADKRPGASRVVAPISAVGAQPRGNSLSAVAAGATTPRVTWAVLSGKKRRQPMQSERQKVSGRAQPQAYPPLLKSSGQGHLRSRRTWERAGITSSEGGVLSRPPPIQQILNTLLRRL